MSFDIRGNDFRAFEQISNGEHNLGSVVMTGGNLSKVNNHFHLKLLNGKKIADGSNNEVRKALYDAVLGYDTEKSLTDDQLAAIRERLGLNANGDIGDNPICKCDLTRREIKRIVSFVKEIKNAQTLFGDNFSDRLKDEINESNLTPERRDALLKNLLGTEGTEGQLTLLKQMFSRSLTIYFSGADDGSIKDHEDPMSGRAEKSETDAHATCTRFIRQFEEFSGAADEAIESGFATLKRQAEEKLDALEQALKGIHANDGREAAIQEQLNVCRNDVKALGDGLVADLNDKLTQLLTTDFGDGKDPKALAANFVQTKISERYNTVNDQIVKLTASITNLGSTVREENEARRIKLEKGHNEIKACFQRATDDLEKTTKNIGRFEALDPQLSLNPRTEERADGDRVRNALDDIVEIHRKTLAAKEAQAERYTRDADSYTADNIDEKKAAYTDQLKQLFAEEAESINARIDKLNRDLTVTKFPRLAENQDQAVEQARAETEQLRTALTGKLAAEWDSAGKAFGELVTSAEVGFKGLAYLTEDQRTEIASELAKLKERFGDANRETFVKNHPVRDPGPQDILEKAKSDLEKLASNAREMDARASHLTAQRKLEMIAKWVSLDSEAFKTMLEDFCTLTGGTDILAGIPKDAAEFLKLALHGTISGGINDLKDEVKALREGGTYRNRTISAHDLNVKIDEILQRVRSAILKPEIIARAKEAPALFSPYEDALEKERAKLCGTVKNYRDQFAKLKLSLNSSKVADDLVKGNQDLFDRMFKGFKHDFCYRFVATGASESVPKVEDMSKSFAGVVSRRLKQELVMQKMLHQNNDLIADKAYGSGNDDKAMQVVRRINAVLSKIHEDQKSVGKDPVLTEDTYTNLLKLMKLKKFDPVEIEKIFGEGKSEMSLAEVLMVSAVDVKVDLDIGPAPAVTNGVNGASFEK